ncbi:glycine cleavage system H protein [Bowdeniella nasicola]|uniref:Glycine cleavage system H protein n=1 Tax=Bowdeniella nasicola TaxID=208480 RepID=A0A1H3WDN0_9ACTO|nr:MULTISPECIES: glycine cleavage system protein GcvH [Bowdeniella]SDZ84941.1 glycine cleavage system H protein [Bowdeniella nasicola]
MAFPTDRKYSSDHEWIAEDGTVGITDFAADALGDVVYVDLPEVGSEVTAGETCGEIESTKSVSDLISPVTGTVEEVNDDVVDAPETVNSDPFGAGWLFKVNVEEEGELLDAAGYEELTAGGGQ